ncbi:tetratricopeptide repeat protein [Paraflavitalea soli]|nr:tetratricopeptide repeat protein [Paraflavitalea soli]
MKLALSFVLYLLLPCLFVSAQDALIQPFLREWKIADTSQSHRAQVFYDALKNDRDTAQYRLVITSLNVWLEDHPDKRLEARTIIYAALGAREYGYSITQYIPLLQKAMTLAHDLEDDQLMAEIYSLYANLASEENYPLYNLKAIELQRKIGFEHFSYVHHRFFDISRALYLTQDYRQSINFGLTCLSLSNQDLQHWDDFMYIFQLDILGACYKQLGLYDSVSYYYDQIEKFLPVSRTTHIDKDFLTIWRGIARGNRGQVLAHQGNYEAAIPLIEEHLNSSLAVHDALNQALSTNALAAIYRQQGNNSRALNYWRQALQAAIQANSPDNALQAAKGIADLMRQTGNKDSAIIYYERYHEHKDTLAARLGRNRLSAMHARIVFDDLQNTLLKSQAALDATRFTRNVILAGIIVAALIALLLYNRFRLKSQVALQASQRKKELAEQEAQRAREQIASYTSHIIEKNNFIESLQQQLLTKEQSEPEEEVPAHLLQYTLFTDNEWEKFKVEFAKAYPDFLSTLRTRVEQITPAEERLATLIYLQLSTYQIANTLGISKDSVLRAKRRLKKRLDLPEQVTVEEYIYNLLATN